jgi:glycolate oxidase FAD binding subunit
MPVEAFAATIRSAAARGEPLCIRGGGSKDFYGGAPHGEKLDVGGYRGIIDYEPSELVLTARAGTPLVEIEAALRERGQMLAFEPPHFGALPSPPTPLPRAGEGSVVPASPAKDSATFGGCIACGLSGPRRASAGAVRDFVLGVRILDGKGDDLRFGGQVMKNVAGFDVSRLMAGSLGTLGLLLEISVKVLPLPVAEATLRFEHSAADAIALLNAWGGRPLPISASAWRSGELSVRLSGARAAVDAAKRELGGEQIEDVQANTFWAGIREQRDAFFETKLPLWRLSLKSTTPPLNLAGNQLIEWGGSLRWLATDADPATVREAARFGGGHATLFRGGDKSVGVFQPLPPALMSVQRNLKRALDPAGIFNRGRLYSEF